ncbi:hypothetical protein [Dokdonella soli]|uniref:EF-hand domain-containing protein n=1 Tax=Dokdonella soli TaxID=529810 RepID=A0ABN1IBI2_9GAMM
MSSKFGNTLGVAIGAAFIGSLSLSQLAAASPAFQAGDLASGYMLAMAGEGKCGEGRCGVAKLDKDGDGKVSMEEAKAGGFSESQFKAWDKNGDGQLDATELAAMHAAMDKGHHKDKKGAEGSCGGDKKAATKGAEGSCGGDKKEKGAEGSCGAHG